MKLHDLDMDRVPFEVTARCLGRYLGHYKGGRAMQTNRNEFARSYGKCSQSETTLQMKAKYDGQKTFKDLSLPLQSLDEVGQIFVIIQRKRIMASLEFSSDNEMEILQEYYQEPEPEETISSMLGKVFDEWIELIAKKVKLDEETFQLVETEGMTAWEPTKEEITKYPELEYTSEEIKAVVAKMSKKQQIQFKELETIFSLNTSKQAICVPFIRKLDKL